MLSLPWATPLVAIAALAGGGALAVLSPSRRAAWAIALVAALAAAAVVCTMGWRELAGEGLIEGIAWLRIDGVAAFTAPIVILAVVAALFMEGARSDASRAGALVAALHVIGAAAWIGALLARDWIALVLCAQIGWLSVVALTALAGDRGALNGALRMLTAGGAGAALMVLGVALLARATGGADLSALADAISTAPQMATLGVMLISAPLLLMAGVAPLYSWAGAAYGRAISAPVLLVASLAALALTLRIAASAAGAPAIAENVATALIVLGLASVVIGSLQAIGAGNVRRLVAYAGATQGGCILAAVALGSPAGFAAALILMVALAASGFALLAGAAASKAPETVALDGLARRAPLAGVAITAGALCWMGAPLTIGFLGRWRLIEAGVGAGWWWATGVAIVASLAAVFYGGRLIERIYFRRASELSEFDRDPWRWARAPVLVVAIATIAYGVAPGWLLDFAARAAGRALGIGP